MAGRTPRVKLPSGYRDNISWLDDPWYTARIVGTFLLVTFGVALIVYAATHEVEVPVTGTKLIMDRIKGLFDGTAPAGDSTTNLTQVNFGDFDPSREDHRALAAQIVEHTRGAGGPSRRSAGSSPLPDAPGAVEDEWP